MARVRKINGSRHGLENLVVCAVLPGRILYKDEGVKAGSEFWRNIGQVGVNIL